MNIIVNATAAAMLVFAAAAINTAPALAQENEHRQLFDTIILLKPEQLPHPENFLPAPAEPGSAIFYGDYCKYLEGKALRDTERGRQAVEDANLSVDRLMERFGEAMGRDLKVTGYPALAKYILATELTSRQCIVSTKHHFKRMRPYEQMHEQSAVPGRERKNDLTSYPSGHSIRAWAVAMALVAIDPEHQDEILKVGYELCRSRVIVGFHWQTDIEAAMISASAAYARISAEPQFIKLQQDAKEEFNEKR